MRAAAVRRARRSRWRRHLRALRVLLRVFRHFLPLIGWQLGLVVAIVAGISGELAEPWLHQRFVNRVLLGRNPGLLPQILLLYAAAAAGQWVAGSAAHFFALQASERFSVRLRVATYGHLRRMSLRGLGRESTGELVAVLQQFAPEVPDGYLGLLHSVLSSLYRLPASIALMARLSGPLLRWTIPALALYPLYPILTVRPLRRALTALTLYDVRTQGVVNDRVAGLRAMLHRIDTRPDVAEMRSLLWRRVAMRMRVFFVDRLGGLADVAAHQGLSVLLLGLGGLSVMGGHMTVGGLLAFLEYVRGLEGPVRRLMHLPVAAQRVAVVADRVYAVLDRQVDVPAPRSGRSAARVRGELSFLGVCVNGAGGVPILRDVTFTVPAGSVCAVVGSSGAGKSTLATCVPRYIDPDDGAVLLDGEDLRAYDLAGLRAQIAFVPQEGIFFRDTVLANLQLARPSAGTEAVRACLLRAGALEFVDALRETPSGAGAASKAARAAHGLQYRLSEGGGNLSGGQRQRLALARGYLQGGRVLVLDEVLSALDPQAQGRVWQGIAGLRGRCTVLFITHHWEWARRADLVLRLDRGRLVGQGPPAAVIGA